MDKLLVNSLPKSGTHLVCKLLDLMELKFANVNFSSSTIYGRYSLPKSLLRGVVFGQPGVDMGLDINALARLSWVKNSLERVSVGKYCGGHVPYSDCLYTLLSENGFKMIHVVRDPRDVLLSWVHYVPKTNWHYGANGLKDLGLEERVKKVLYGYHSGDFILESFPNILERSSGWLNKKDVLVVRFEDLVGIKGGGDDELQLSAIKRIAAFVGVEITDIKLLANSLFGGTKVFRKGKIGGWQDELSSALSDELNSVLEKQLIAMGYIND